MQYISTRGSQQPVSAAGAINLGMAHGGGLFVPERIPRVDAASAAGASYQETARAVLAPYLDDFTGEELDRCIAGAYNAQTFSAPGIIELTGIGANRSVMELWHGPTAAFKDMALQIMPHLLRTAKRKVGEKAHTVILVATSGDTGKAALEGFRDCEGISIVVFFPHNGVSEIQRLQMVTTEGDNTHVAAVRGNFDDCQNGVKALFADNGLKTSIGAQLFALSSANSINWGRLCPQIAYYYRAYGVLVDRGTIRPGDPVDFCVPTGNFGNILAGFYAQRMGLPVRRLICASNRNKVLTDFFLTGRYERNREFYRTMSPSMDILISSNLERFLFEMTGRDTRRIQGWYRELGRSGRFEIDAGIKADIDRIIVPGWADEDRVTATIGSEFRRTGYVLDTHTAVAAAVAGSVGARDGVHTVIVSTACPYKFSGDVLFGLSGERVADEFESIRRVHAASGMPVHRAVAGLKNKKVRHGAVIGTGDMKQHVLDLCRTISV